MNQASKRTLTFGALLLVMGILSGCEKLSIPWPWQKKEVIQSKEDKIRKLNEEVTNAKKKYEELMAKSAVNKNETVV